MTELQMLSLQTLRPEPAEVSGAETSTFFFCKLDRDLETYHICTGEEDPNEGLSPPEGAQEGAR